MLTLLLPWLFGAAVAGALGVGVLHLLSVRRPPPLALPTARFIVERDVRAVSRSTRPSDLWLLLLRVLALLLAGLAAAMPVWRARTRMVGHVVVADRAWAVTWAADSSTLRADLGEASTTGAVRTVWVDTIDAVGAPVGLRAELGAAWPRAWQEAALLIAQRGDVDSVAVHMYLPSQSASADGWAAWRASWPGRVTARIASVATLAATPAVEAGRRDAVVPVRVVARGDDAVAAAFALHRVPTRSRVVVQREASPDDGTALNADVQVAWPLSGVPRGWSARTSADSAGALVVAGQALVTPWVRRARVGTMPPGARVLARWADGDVAAFERPRDTRDAARDMAGSTGCVREVAVAVAPGSDVLLAPNARPLLAALAAPCGTAALIPTPLSLVAAVARDTGALAGTASLRERMARGATAGIRGGATLPAAAAVSTPSWLPAALVAAAIALLVAELVVRARGDDTAASRGASEFA